MGMTKIARLNLPISEGIEKRLRANGVKIIKLNKKKTRHFLITGDCLKVMKLVPNKSIDLIITDPPYNIGLKYGAFKDRMKKEEYLNWCKERLRECARILKESGTMYLISYPETNAYLLPYLDNELKLKFRRWLTWHYPTNIGHSKRNFTRSQRSILFCTKTDKYVFNRENLIQHYKNPEVKKIKERLKMGSKGRASYDLLRFLDIIELQKGVIDIFDINLLKNVCKDRQKGHLCQLPLGLIRVLIKVSSNKDSVVFDPFAGTFSVSAVAAELDRNSIGIEIEPAYVKIGEKRLRG